MSVEPKPAADVRGIQFTPRNLKDELLCIVNRVPQRGRVHEQEDLHTGPGQSLIPVDERVVSSEGMHEGCCLIE